MSDNSFYNAWRKKLADREERGRGTSVTVASTTHGEITG